MIDLNASDVALITRGRWLNPPTKDFTATGVGIDSRDDLEQRLFIAIKGDRHDGHDFLGAAKARGALAGIVERAPTQGVAPSARDVQAGPGTDSLGLPLLQVPSTRGALADLARATRARFTGRVAAITGSCGKTTTRRLLAAILEQHAPTVQSPKSFNNDLGVPLTVLALRPHHRHLVSEIGMSAVGEIEPLVRIVRPQVAVITMIGHAHIEALGSIEVIAQEKASIVAGLDRDGTIVIPSDSALAASAVDAALARFSLPATMRRLTFGTSRGDARLLTREAESDGSRIEIGGPWGVLCVRLALPGMHNAMNALAAATAAHALGASADAIREGLAAVRPSEMRFVRERVGPYLVCNDAYNANPEAMRASISAFAENERGSARRVTVLGDMLELGVASDALHAELGRWLASAFDGGPPDLAVFVGPRSAAGARSFAQSTSTAMSLAIPDVGAESAELLRNALRPGDAILFKASRGSALERLLVQLAPTPGAVQGAAHA